MLWAITSYFNPSGFKTRPANYRAFRKYLAAPLVAVELSFNGRFELRQGDAEILVQLVGRDVLWQKERLLNVALQHLPNDCDTVAWLDCDVVFARDDWPERAGAALGRFPLVQLFSERCDLASGATRGPAGWSPVYWAAPARGYKIVTGRYQQEVEMRNAGIRVADYSTPGLAWAARRALLDRHGLYDARIIGGGDSAMVGAALGNCERCIDLQRMDDRSSEHYRKWANSFFADVAGKIGYIDGRILHLWHGDRSRRRHEERHRQLATLGFDPCTDIALDPNGCWRWNSYKPMLHEFARRYFESRDEDGSLGSS